MAGILRLGMYVCWFSALWRLRQPLVAETASRRLQAVITELCALALVMITTFSALWQPSLTRQVNLIALLPVAVDILLIAASYHAVRRGSMDLGSAHVWLVGTFVMALVAHAMSGFVMAHGLVVLGAVTVGAMATGLACLTAASARPLRMRESILGGERVTSAVATIGLALAGPAAFAAPRVVGPLVFALAAVLAWQVHRTLSEHGSSDLDPLTGLSDARAIQRHIGGVAATATRATPVAVIGADLIGFGRWNAEHGFGAGDELLVGVADRCVAAPIGPGLWARVGPDRFCWVGRVADEAEAAEWAQIVAAAAGDEAAGISARCGVVMCPTDASTSANVIAAMEESLMAASHTSTTVVAFDRGRLDGAAAEGGYSASFRHRRERIETLLGDDQAVRPVFQPIVALDDLRVVGHEALTRFECEPRRGPDEWIGEAHLVGLGLEVESECVRRAIAHVNGMARGTYLAVNTSPQLILSGVLDHLMPAGRLDWLLVELTEHDQVADYGELATRLDPLRSRGARVAVDDVGAGHSSLRHVVRLAPDYAKLDRSIVESIDSDPARQALVRSMIAFAGEMRCLLVAEGAERPAELETLRSLGVEYAQGYLFRRPEAEMATAISLTQAA